MSDSSSSPSRLLAEHLTDVNFDELPESALEEAKRVLLDSISATLLGIEDPSCDLYRVLIEQSLPPGSTILAGVAKTATRSSAASFHASVSHQVELAPAVSRAVIHLNGIGMGALTQAESVGASGKQLLLSTAQACEAAIRFGLALNRAPDHETRGDYAVAFLKGWWMPALSSIFGTATAGVLLAGGTADQLHNAWGIAANVAPAGVISTVHEGATGKGYLMGAATSNGLAAAALALEGATGLEDIAGHWMSVVAEGCDPTALSDSLEKREFSHVLYKPYAAVGPTFAAIDAALAIAENNPGLNPESIRDIEVIGFGRTLRFFSPEPPTTAEGARGNLAYLVAAAFIHRDAGYFLADAFTATALAETSVLDLAVKVRATVSPDFDREYPLRSAKAQVVVTLSTGERYDALMDRHALSKYHHPSRAELSDKFRSVGSRLLAPAASDKVLELIWNLESIDNVGELMNALGNPRSFGEV